MFFITDFLEEEKPFYIMENGKYSRAFDLEHDGQELTSGGQREHRYGVLVERMKKKGLKPEDFKDYLSAFRYGMPPHGGFGMGVDRLVQKMLGIDNIRETILHPRDMKRVLP
jgi:aspartyl-tRNA synthetase